MIRIPLLRTARAAAIALGILLVSGCEDPSGVGLDVIDFGETDPRAQAIEAVTEMDSLVDPTGFVRPATGEFLNRFLAGRAQDPLFGTVEATGYIDFARPLNLPLGFLGSPVRGAFLSLQPDYVYGDTSGVATFDVFQVRDSWNAQTFRSDTTLAVYERLLATFQVSASDTLVHVQLSQEWVEEADTLFRAEDFEARFNGFQIRPRPESRMARGFRGTSTLEFISNFASETVADTVGYIAFAIASGIQRDLQFANPPPELFPLQDGSGEGLFLSFQLDTLDSPALSAGFIRVDADTLLLQQQLPPHFVRPLATRLALFGMGAGQPVLLAETQLDTAKQAYTFTSTLLNVVLQDMALGRSAFDRLAIGFPRTPSTLDVAPITSIPGARPRAVLIVVPVPS